MRDDTGKWWTDETTTFVEETKAVCARCGHGGWGTYDGKRRCHACGRIVIEDTDTDDHSERPRFERISSVGADIEAGATYSERRGTW